MKCFNRARKTKRGTTLVEVIVSFALLGLFLVSATQLISSTLHTYHKIRAVNYGRQVSDTIMTKIVGQLEGATVGKEPTEDPAGEEEDIADAIISEDGGTIEFYDKEGTHVYISTSTRRREEKLFAIHYYSTETADGAGFKKVDWMFDPAVYMGFVIKELKFTQASTEQDEDGQLIGYPDNVVKVAITIHSPRYGDYTAWRYVKCYHITRIDTGEIAPDTEIT